MTDTPQPNNATEDLSDLGPYAIESRLGQGGMGIVYLATDKNLGRQVAIKVLHPHLLRHENLKQRFRREARMHAKLMHPNIVTLLSLYEDEKHMALVMEKIDGQDLKAYLKTKLNIPMDKKLSIAMDVLTGLAAAHQFGMVHRDLKPANVLISKRGEVKLLDFGLAKPEEGEDDLTQSGVTVGSFRYMAPEQILNKPIDARTDLYAFGILLFYMLTGKLPFDATNNGGEFEIMEKQVREPAPIPQQLNPRIPKDLSELILQLLQKNKHDRPESAVAVREKILSIYESILQPEKTKEQHKTKKTSLHIPDLPTPLSNKEVAKQWINYGKYKYKKLRVIVAPYFNKFFKGFAAVAWLFLLLGTLVIIVLNMAEDNAKQGQNKQNITPTTSHLTPPKVEIKPIVQKTEPSPIEPVAAAPIHENKIKQKAVTKTAVVKKVPKSKIKKKPKKKVVKSLTFKQKHQVSRNDSTKVNSNKPHEFRGGSHLFFPQLAKKGWINSFKRGETSVKFDQAVSISTIILHKASVGKLDFKHGFVYLEVQAPNNRKWISLFERKNDDVDIKVVIKNVKKKVPLIRAVRVRFKTADPITIGPIDLLH